MPRVFVSHAHTDSKLAEEFVFTVIQHGAGLSDDDVFYSSGAATGAPSGVDLNEHVRRRVDEAGLVVALITPSFEESAFCWAELGAAWSRAGNLFPFKLPGASHATMKGVLSGLVVRSLDDDTALDELHDRLETLTGVRVGARRWGNRKRAWLERVDALAAAAAVRHKGQTAVCGVGVRRSDSRHHGELFRLNADSSIEHCWIPDDETDRDAWGWSDWVSFHDTGDAIDLAAVQDREDRALLFVLARDGSVRCHEWTLEDRWKPAKSFGRPFNRPATSIAASSREATQIDVFVTARDGTVRMKWCWEDRWDDDGRHDGWHTLYPIKK